MSQHTAQTFPTTIGLDLGSSVTQVAIYNGSGERIEERKISTTKISVEQLLGRFPAARVVMEASTPTRWICDIAREGGHEVIVANPRRIPIITANIRKSDRNDARLLGELGQMKPELLGPVELRDGVYQRVRARLFARAQLVRTRSKLCTFVRSQVKSTGEALPPGSTRCFAKRVESHIPSDLTDELQPILLVIQQVSDEIDAMDARIKEISEKQFPQTAVLQQVHGVGPLVALAFIATVGAPDRTKDSRSLGPYLGLVPRLDQSGQSNPALSITKHGDTYMRSLLVSSATRILGPFGPDSDLRRFGTRIIDKGGQRARATARIVVARKLAVLLHRLLLTSEVYEPLRSREPGTSGADAA